MGSADEMASSGEEGEAGSSAITFSMSVSGSADQLKELLTRFERSIRVIDITSAELQANERDLSLTILGKAYFEPAQVIELQSKVVKP